MKKTERRPRPFLLQLWLTCALAISNCAKTSPPTMLRAEVAGAVVRVDLDVDDHVRASQAVIEAYR